MNDPATASMNDLTTGSVTRRILLFSLPMLIGNLFQQAYSIVDAVVVGRFVDGKALAAVGVAMNALAFVLSALIGLTTGASVLISQYYGAKRHDRLERAVSTSIVFLAGLSLALTVAGIALTPAILTLLDASPDIAGDAETYMRTLMGGMAFTVFYNMYTAYLRALGDARGPLYILICCTALNTGLDLLFVCGFHMEVLGAAVATVISQAASAALCYLYARKRAPLLRVRKLAFDGALFGDILKYGAPAALQLSIVSFASLAITRLINSFGAVAMAGITAASRIDQLAITPVSNVSMALTSFVAQNMGAGLEERAKSGLRSALLFMSALAVAISVLLIRFGSELVAMFLSDADAASGDILKVGADYLGILSASYVLFATLFAFNGFFRGVGDAVIAMAFPVASLTIRTVSAYMLAGLAGMGPEALAWSIPVGWGLTSLASLAYYRRRLWAGKLAATSSTP